MSCKIYFYITGGFGNKIFDIITCLYLIYKYKCKIFVAIRYTHHNKDDDPLIYNLFDNLQKYITFIPLKILYKIKNTAKEINFEKYQTLTDLPERLSGNYIISNKCHMYKFTVDMYNIISKTYLNNAFEFDKQFIPRNELIISNKDYIAVHIRYGDKLEIALEKYNNSNDVKNTTFIIYKPIYYIALINLFLKKTDLPIYIFTDSKNIVEKVILPHVKNSRVKFLDVPYWVSFYLIKNSVFSILSFSTFGMQFQVYHHI